MADPGSHGKRLLKWIWCSIHMPVVLLHRDNEYAKHSSIVTTRSELRKVLFLAPSVWVFLCVYEISPEPLNGFAPNSHGRHVWSLSWTCLTVKVTRDKKRHFSALLAACVQFMFGKTSLEFFFVYFSRNVVSVEFRVFFVRACTKLISLS